MNKYGLDNDVLAEIAAIFEQYPPVSRVVLFGSRAMGTHRPGSDIDLAIEGDDLGLWDIVNLLDALEELDLLYSFDLLNRQNIAEPALIDHINRVGVPIYNRLPVTAS
ncbi:nucleotidyltransferase domain-containing protein [Spirosoma rhododendri]|uniref:Nucleotidyltransferase domain-containing protein n=1 Tax=Spirosoma rhododendri TaxID=2728024 RepID=A0A7L5DRE3_9BACT|nr:nucleotidyltransferase domain-containing protein [Spirosoma rhododendri]QJD79793.1 nucleotidyltransferase domain-containing protein [Spirosoma rhododendri]